MSALVFRTLLEGPEATSLFGKSMAAILLPGDTLLLTGDIGAGKTHFARALIQSLQDIPEDVPSPTFTLVQTYDTVKGELLHADMYRLGGQDEAAELGLLDAFGTSICIVEWPDRLGSDSPADALRLEFESTPTDEARTVTITSDADSWRNRLSEVLNA